MNQKNTLRFWVYFNRGFVKLSLREGEALTHFRAWDNGEGVSAETNIFSHDSGMITWACHGVWRDCDGPGESYSAYESRDLQGFESSNPKAPPLPKWQEKRAFQRDIYAENAGY